MVDAGWKSVSEGKKVSINASGLALSVGNGWTKETVAGEVSRLVLGMTLRSAIKESLISLDCASLSTDVHGNVSNGLVIKFLW